MAYEKITPAVWVEKLRSGGFETSTSARKSLGRAAWPRGMKDRVTLLVERHFSGHKLDQKDVDALTSEEGLPGGGAAGKKRKPQRTPVAPPQPRQSRHPVRRGAGAEAPVGPYEDLRAIITTTRDALMALKTMREIDPKISMPDELDLCMDMITTCIKELGERVPDDIKKAVARLQREYEDDPPKAPGAATPAAPSPVPEPGVPLESNEEGFVLWNKTRPSRSPVKA